MKRFLLLGTGAGLCFLAGFGVGEFFPVATGLCILGACLTWVVVDFVISVFAPKE